MKIAQSPEIISLANTLGYREGCPVDSLRSHCLNRLKGFLSGKTVRNMDEMEDIVLSELQLRVHRIWSDQELEALMTDYVSRGEIIFASLKQQLSPDAYGIFIKLTKPNANGEPWVCIVDCRDEKRHKRHWTLWHEVTHCLTFTDDMELPLRRTTILAETEDEKEPIEILTDYIAKDLAFYPPIFNPILKSELAKADGKISFALIERVRNQFSPEASFESTMNACVDRCGSPYLVVESALGFNKREQIAKNAGDETIKPTLRVLRTYSNEKARNTGTFIPKNYRIPETSIITKAHLSPISGLTYGLRNTEDLGTWSNSGGRHLPNKVVTVEAKKVGSRLLSIMAIEAA